MLASSTPSFLFPSRPRFSPASDPDPPPSSPVVLSPAPNCQSASPSRINNSALTGFIGFCVGRMRTSAGTLKIHPTSVTAPTAAMNPLAAREKLHSHPQSALVKNDLSLTSRSRVTSPHV